MCKYLKNHTKSSNSSQVRLPKTKNLDLIEVNIHKKRNKRPEQKDGFNRSQKLAKMSAVCDRSYLVNSRYIAEDDLVDEQPSMLEHTNPSQKNTFFEPNSANRPESVNGNEFDMNLDDDFPLQNKVILVKQKMAIAKSRFV